MFCSFIVLMKIRISRCVLFGNRVVGKYSQPWTPTRNVNLKKINNRWNIKCLFLKVPTLEPTAPPEEVIPPGHLPIELIEVKARGRFGAVWKARYNKTETVAVKIFPVQDKQSWLAEQVIFQLPHMDHDDILRFIGIEQHGDYWRAEYWLITAYHEKGSLCDYLKANTVTWTELCTIAESMSRYGLLKS